MSEDIQLKTGTLVRIVRPSPLLKLESYEGRIVRQTEWRDYYIVRLDKPAIFRDGNQESLWEILENVDNLEVRA